MTADELKRLRELAEAATPGPWRNGADPSHFDAPEVTDDCTFSYYVPDHDDAAFIAAARTGVPRLFDLVDDLIFQRDKARRERDSYANSDFERQLDEARVDLTTALRERDEARAAHREGLELAARLNQRALAECDRLRDAVHAWRNWSDEVAPPWGSKEPRDDEGQRTKIAAALASLTAERDEARAAALTDEEREALRFTIEVADETADRSHNEALDRAAVDKLLAASTRRDG